MTGKLRQSIEQLIARYEEAKSDNTRLREMLDKSQSELKACRSRIEILEKKIHSLELAGAFLNSTGDKDARKRVDRLIKEIDKCIEMLES